MHVRKHPQAQARAPTLSPLPPIHAHRMKRFIGNAWNWLDVVLIVVSLAALGQARRWEWEGGGGKEGRGKG